MARRPEAVSSSSLFSNRKAKRKKQKDETTCDQKTRAAMVSTALNASARGVAATNKGARIERESKEKRRPTTATKKKRGDIEALRAFAGKALLCFLALLAV